MRRLLVCVVLSACTSPANDTPDADPAAAPSGLEITDRRATELALRWQPGTATLLFLAYVKGTTPPVACSPGPLVMDLAITTATVSGLDARTAYAFRLCGVDDRGGTLQIGAGVTATDRTLALAPGEVTNLQLAGTNGTLTATWSAATGAVGYRVAYAQGLTAPATCANGTATTQPSFTFASLATDKTYAVRVCAVNDNPTPDISPGVTAVALLHAAGAANPTNLVISDLHSGWVRLATAVVIPTSGLVKIAMTPWRDTRFEGQTNVSVTQFQ